MRRAVLLVITGTLISNACFGYETETHALMTNQAYVQSLLNPANAGAVLHNLGLDRLDTTTPFEIYWGAPIPTAGPDEYVDNIMNALYPPGEFERCNMQEFLNAGFAPSDPRVLLFNPTVEVQNQTPALLPLRNWLVRGAIREDDLGVATATYFLSHCGLLTFGVDTGNTVRVLNHFYDPINNVGLSGGPAACPPGFGPCQRSVDWAQGVTDSFPVPPALPTIDTNRRNHFSYEDARQAMWLALTQEFATPGFTAATNGDRNNAAAYRLYQWATVFRDMGDVVHLLQDTSQPQHVRNDPHSFIQSPEQQALEGFTNARVLGQSVGKISGDAGSYIREFFGANLAATIPTPPLGSYPTVTFATPVRFFTTRAYNDTAATSPDNRYGLADYANRGFFTGGTLPGSSTNPYAEPVQTINSANGYTAVPVPCLAATPTFHSQTQAVTCTHYTHAVSDTVSTYNQDVLPTGFTQPPLLADGIFSQAIGFFVSGSSYVSKQAIGIEELITMANLTIPRAIGYSTGMMNYFFRGTLDVQTTASGVLSVLDQSATHTMNQYGYPCIGSVASDGCAILGFTKVRVKLHNSTPNLTESIPGSAAIPQDMQTTQAGNPRDPYLGETYLIAIARYHRNACYQPSSNPPALNNNSLDGLPSQAYGTPGTITYPPTTCAHGSVRTPYQEISVSNSIAMSATDLNNRATATEELFDFSTDPIPVNATDLFIQVVYRGALGSSSDSTKREEDAIAIGTLDVPETSFAAFFNNTDYFLASGPTWTPDTTNPNILTTMTALELCTGLAPKIQLYKFTSGGAGDVIGYPTSHDNPGSVRLALLLKAQPSNPLGTVGMGAKYTSSNPHTPPLTPTITLSFKPNVTQSNVERLSDGFLASPVSNCPTTDPTSAACWRFDPAQKRRGIVWGFDWHPLYIDETSGATPPDVDKVSLPAFTVTTLRNDGVVLFNNTSPTACSF